jgi:uncharacterized protein YjbI with pentapeptide repeats
MKIFKPDHLGLLHRSMKVAGKKQLSIGLMGFFSFDQSDLAHLLPEAQMWEIATAAMGKDAILDEGWPKTAGEFVAFGAACAPSGVTATELVATVGVGNVRKSLFVRGDRHFTALGLISAPAPFTTMPISPQTTFGGPGSPANPSGKGLVKTLLPDGSATLPLPNVEDANFPVLRAGDAPPPAGFWPSAAHAPGRVQHFGKFDQRWLQNTWPHLPEDTNLDYFQTAPPDQRINGFFKGDEAIACLNLHAQKPQLNSALPRLRARCFINRLTGGKPQFIELPARLETVLLFPNQACGIVLYRALADISDEDGDDVLHLLADWEDLANQPLPFAHYHDSFLREVSPTGAVAQALDDAAEAPVAPKNASKATVAPVLSATAAIVSVASASAVPGVTPAIQKALSEVSVLAADLEADSRALMVKHGITQADLAPFLAEAPELPPASLAEVEKMAADVEADARKLMAKHNISEAELAPFLKPPPPESPASASELGKALADLNADTAKNMREHGITAKDVAAFASSRPELAGVAEGLVADPVAGSAAIAAMFATIGSIKPPPAIALPSLSLPKIDSETPLAKFETREQVIAHHAAKKSFAGLDVSGLDLSGLDLNGADFSNALLDKTSLVNAQLAKVNFAHALTPGADFSGADLRGASLVSVSASAARFTGVHFDGCDLSQGDFSEADFTGATLSKAVLSGSLFNAAKLGGVQAAGCTAVQASFAGSDLSRADFSKAQLHTASFSGATLEHTRFDQANCAEAEFFGAVAPGAMFVGANLAASRADATSQFKGADFASAQMQRASWGGADISSASLLGAGLDDADFSKARAPGAVFSKAQARGAKFDKADLSGADLSKVNLLGASLRHATVSGTLLHSSNLYAADLYGTTPSKVALEGSDIGQTILAARGLA